MLDAEMKRSLSAVLSRLVNLTWLQTIKGKHCVQFLIGERYTCTGWDAFFEPHTAGNISTVPEFPPKNVILLSESVQNMWRMRLILSEGNKQLKFFKVAHIGFSLILQKFWHEE